MLSGNGLKVRFWKDKWCGDDPLYVTFSSLFSFGRFKRGVGDGCLGLFS